jgi:hypothetical protein
MIIIKTADLQIKYKRREKKVRSMEEKIEEAVAFINFYRVRGFDLWEFFPRHGITESDRIKFIRKVNRGLNKVWKSEICIVRNLDDEEVQIKEIVKNVKKITRGTFSIKSKKLTTNYY